MSSKHVKVKGHFLVDGKTLVDPGSVVVLDKDMAEQFVKRGLGTNHPGPVHHVQGGARPAAKPAVDEEPEEEGRPAPESLDLGSRLERAEKATGRGQARRAGAV